MKHREIEYISSTSSKEGVSFTAFSPVSSQGSLVVAATSRAREALGGHVASRLALEHFADGVLSKWGEVHGIGSLEEGFRTANRAVFDFGARLSAGGRMSASLMALAVDEDTIAVARAGKGGAYLFRGGEFVPFFEEEVLAHPQDPTQGVYVGAQPKVAVQTSSIPCAELDTVLLLSRVLSHEEQSMVQGIFARGGAHYRAYLRKFLESFEFGLCAILDNQVVYLSHPVVE